MHRKQLGVRLCIMPGLPMYLVQELNVSTEVFIPIIYVSFHKYMKND